MHRIKKILISDRSFGVFELYKFAVKNKSDFNLDKIIVQKDFLSAPYSTHDFKVHGPFYIDKITNQTFRKSEPQNILGELKSFVHQNSNTDYEDFLKEHDRLIQQIGVFFIDEVKDIKEVFTIEYDPFLREEYLANQCYWDLHPFIFF